MHAVGPTAYCTTFTEAIGRPQAQSQDRVIFLAFTRLHGEGIRARARWTIYLNRNWRRDVKPAFHDADTDTNILADIVERIVARISTCRSACHRNSQEVARVGRKGRVGRVGVGVGVVECGL